MLEPNQLRIFLVAAETLNFSRTAERLHMSQPSVTQNIQLLENHFNAQLFIRSGRRLALTETGQALLPLARQLVTFSLRADEVMDSLRKEVHGQLIIACSTTPGKYILPLVLANFMKQYPQVQARCEVHARSAAFELLERGSVHVALSNSIEEFHQDIEFRKFLTDPVVLIAPLQHPWAHRGEISPEELLSARFIMREENAGTYRATRSAMARVGLNINDLQTILTLGNSEAIAISVEHGLGVGFVSGMVFSQMMEGRVARVRVRGLRIEQEIYLCRHRLHAFGNLQNAFWQFTGQPLEQIISDLSEIA